MAKIGRNEPCPCGSGKKYKKCCGTSLSAGGSKVSSKLASLNPSLIAQQWMKERRKAKPGDSKLKLILDRYKVDETSALDRVRALGEVQELTVLFYRGEQWIGEADLSFEGEIVMTTSDKDSANELKAKLTAIPGLTYGSRTEDVFETLDEDAKVRVAEGMLEFKVKFFRGWLDEPNERLKGQTPRQAAQNPQLKNQLVKLLDELESREQRLPKKERYRFNGVKRELNL
jgi:SEC-C motif